MTDQTAALMPFVRIGLYFLTGWLFADPSHPAATIITEDPQVLGMITGAIVAAWYFAARRLGWER